MCYNTRITKPAEELEKRFNATFENKDQLQIPSVFNAFTFPQTPVITNNHIDKIQLFNWGLIPPWAKDITIRKNTLNARVETIHEKPSFKGVLNNRCLVIADGFYEWQWLDDKGKQKQKYELVLPDEELFGFAGLWNEWVDKETGEIINTYTILTTQANELMSKIHNTKKRMPVIIKKGFEKDWLLDSKMNLDNDRIIAKML
ncbi:MAG TPA: SOS response-associated peptidase [Bacteroidia bacterium]|nr:SOS response-associated peptidase [Bacteroidia bacterium]